MKNYIPALIFWIACNCLHAQDWLGYHTSTYAGINAVHINPALITGTPYKKFDLSLVAGHANVSNNYLFINSATITDPGLFSAPDFQRLYIREITNGWNKSAFANINVQGPAVLVQITDKDAIGFSPRVRGFMNADNVDERLAKLIFEELDYPPYWDQGLQHNYLPVQTHIWAEYGFTYARTFYEGSNGSFKGGISLKLIQGLASAYMAARNSGVEFYNDDTMRITRTFVAYGMTQNIESNQFAFNFTGAGFGIDIGFTYERMEGELFRNGLYRPRKKEKNQYGIWAADQTKYKWKIGLAINDIGTSSYTKSTNSRDFFADVDSLPLNAFDGIQGVNGLNQRIQALFVQANDNTRYWMDLPTHFNGFFDYRFDKGFALNTTVQLPLQHGSADDSKNHYLYQLSVTPRWESRWFGVYMPFSFNEYLLFNWGLSLRLGPLVIGTGDILGHLIKREYASADVHFALRIIIPDKDNRPGWMKKRAKCPAYW